MFFNRKYRSSQLVVCCLQSGRRILLDENHEIADAFGARTTPHVFLFDRDAKLAYRGLIDDNGENKNEVSNHYLADAMNSMVAGQAINPNTTKSVGCSIKRLAP